MNEMIGWVTGFFTFIETMMKDFPFLSATISFLTGGSAVKLWSVLLERRDKSRERAKQDLDDLYGPLELHFQSSKSLDAYVNDHKGTLSKQVNRFDKQMEPLIRDAINKFVAGPGMGFSEPLSEEQNRSLKDLKKIEKLLRPLVFAKAKKLRKITQ